MPDAPKHTLASASDLRPAKYNPRKISQKAAEGLGGSLEEFGDLSGITWNSRTGVLVAGHQRVEQLRKLGAVFVSDKDGARFELVREGRTLAFKVRVVDWPVEKEKAANIAANNPKIAGEFSGDIDALLEEVRGSLGADKFSLLQFDALSLDLGINRTQRDNEDDDPEPLPDTVVQPGDLWVLGPHRLVCGDSTDRAVVERVVGDRRPNLMVTDPLYGVNYDPSWRTSVKRSDGGNVTVKLTGEVKNDHLSDWTAAYKLFAGNIAYVWHADLQTDVVIANLESCGLVRRAKIIWAKDHAAIGRGAYHWQHETAWYVVRKGKTAAWNGDRKQTTLWKITAHTHGWATSKVKAGHENFAAGGQHSTQKPVEAMRRPMLHHTKPGQAVYEPFNGSGATIIAAETCSRVALAVELEPAYVEQAVMRWQVFTGKVAKLDTGETLEELRTKRKPTKAPKPPPAPETIDADPDGVAGPVEES